MTTIHEIQQVIWFDTPLGIGQALFLIDYGPHENIIFVIALKKDGVIKHFSSEQIKLSTNYTLDINKNARK